MTTNGNHQAHEPTASDQQKPSSPRSPARPRARRSRFGEHAPDLRGKRGSGGIFMLWDLPGTSAFGILGPESLAESLSGPVSGITAGKRLSAPRVR